VLWPTELVFYRLGSELRSLIKTQQQQQLDLNSDLYRLWSIETFWARGLSCISTKAIFIRSERQRNTHTGAGVLRLWVSIAAVEDLGLFCCGLARAKPAAIFLNFFGTCLSLVDPEIQGFFPAEFVLGESQLTYMSIRKQEWMKA